MDDHSGDNVISGSTGNIVQAGTILGDIHFHRPGWPAPRQLPARIAKLVNQRRVLSELDESLRRDAPINVLLGARGSGKSTVAVHWMHEHSERFPDGQLHANLGAWTDHTTAPNEVLASFLTSLGVDRGQLPPDLETRASWFRTRTSGKAFQILLDDAVTAAQVAALLPGPGNSMVVVTGHGEFGGLKQNNATFIDLEPLEPDMAAELLRQFADDRVDAEPEERDTLVELCGGLPVALTIVGQMLANAPGLSLSDLLEELADPDMGMTELSAVFDAGYRRLSELGQRCYQVIGAHPSGSDIPVGAVAAALKLSKARTRAAVRELVTKRVVEEPRPGRLVVHNLVREYARQLPRTVDVRERILRWYEAGAVAADSHLMTGRPWRRELFPDLVVDETHPAFTDENWLEAERQNLKAAVKLAYDLGTHDIVQHMCVALWSLHERGKYYDDLRYTNELGLRAEGSELVKALLRVQLSYAAAYRGETAKAIELCETAADAARQVGHIGLEATAVEAAGLAALAQGDHDNALRLLRRNLELAESVEDPRRTALAALHLAKVERVDVAKSLLARAMAGLAGEPVNRAKVLLWQGRRLGHVDGLDEALKIMTGNGRPYDLGQIQETLGDLTGDAAYYQRAMETYRDNGLVSSAAAISGKLTVAE